jgi:hypothetical protein
MRPISFKQLIEPWAHQDKEYHYSRDLEARALHWSMRTGKSKVIIDTAAYLYCHNLIDAVLVIARSGVHANWPRREIPKHCAVPYIADYWDAAKADRKSYQGQLHEMITSEKLIWFAVNNESFIRPKAQQFIRQLLRLRLLLVVDEVHDFRTHNSKRSKLMHVLAPLCLYRRTLTGTNKGNCPLGNWSQFEILHKAALGYEKYTAFKNQYAVLGLGQSQNRMYETIEGYKNLPEMQGSIDRWTSTILRKDCPDLPPLVSSSYDCGITPEQQHVYRELKTKFKIELANGTIVRGKDIAIRLMKLQQVVSNFIIDQQGHEHTISETNPRISRLLEILNDVDAKTIIWAKFQYDLDRIAEALKAAGISFVEYHGRITKSERYKAEDRFRDDSSCQNFLGQPQSAGQGLDLSAADYIIWYSHTYDLVIRDQANERATEKGSTAVGVIDMVVPNSIDEYILENHDFKRRVHAEMDEAQKEVNLRTSTLEFLEKDLI